MKIAVSGKGGVGKTTVAACLSRLFAANGRNVYAVDADPDSSLGATLGIPAFRLDALKPIFEMSEYIDDKAGDGALYLMSADVGGTADKFSVVVGGVASCEASGGPSGKASGEIRFLRMCGVKAGGSSCYCRENSFLKALVNSLLLGAKDVAVLDMCAGVEHLARGTAGGVDMMLIVAEPSRQSVETARAAKRLSVQLGIPAVRFIGNKARNEKDEMFIRANFPREELLGCARYSEAIAERAMGLSGVANGDAGDGGLGLCSAAGLTTILGKIAN